MSDTLFGDQQLYKDQQISSKNRIYRFIMQSDGNLVVYKLKNPLWASNTVGRGEHFIMQRDGNAVLYDSNGKALWSSGTHNTGANRIVMQDDGNLVVYDGNNSAKWATGTNGK